MGYPTLTFQYEDEIATIALTVPEKRNAISAQMITDLLGALEQAEEAPRAFSSSPVREKHSAPGMDLDELQHIARQTQQKNFEDSRRVAKMLYRFTAFPSP